MPQVLVFTVPVGEEERVAYTYRDWSKLSDEFVSKGYLLDGGALAQPTVDPGLRAYAVIVDGAVEWRVEADPEDPQGWDAWMRDYSGLGEHFVMEPE